jgi:hypothetical protein
MNERLVVLSGTLVNPTEGGAVGALDFYQNVPCDVIIVYVCASSDTDDPGLTFDINDDGSGAITGIDCADKEDPGEWISTHCGGTNTPVRVAAGSELSFDANNAANATTVHYSIWCLTSDVWA